MYDEKKKPRGRPKKTVTTISETVIDEQNSAKKKRGRKKKQDTIVIYQAVSMGATERESNDYIVMLDIKPSDLDTTTTTVDLGKSKTDRLIYDDLLDQFSRLLEQRQKMVSNSTVSKVHDQMTMPETCTDVGFSMNNDDGQKGGGITVLSIFKENGDSWPTTSPYSCWNCDSQFNGVPVGIPDFIDDNSFYCCGNFCSFPCATRYIIDNEHSISRFEKISMLNMLNQKINNLDVTDKIQIAYPKQVLHKYGGYMTYGQYHNMDDNNASDSSGGDVELYKLPIIPIYYYISNCINPSETEDDKKQTMIFGGSNFSMETASKALDL